MLLWIVSLITFFLVYRRYCRSWYCSRWRTGRKQFIRGQRYWRRRHFTSENWY